MLPRFETITRIQNVSTELSLGTQVWRTHRGDKTPVVIPVGSETGDDTILATTDGRTLNIDYVTAAGPGPVLDVARCQAITRAGNQCRRSPTTGAVFCWQHGN